MSQRHVVLVHGIWRGPTLWDKMKPQLENAGFVVHTPTLKKRDGSLPIADLAKALEEDLSALKAQPFDLLGFSMGAVVSRTMLQRSAIKENIRRFLSISGPHRGTVSAYGWPLRGARDLEPKSRFIRELNEEGRDPTSVEVHSIYTPYDGMIIPHHSSHLPFAKTNTAIPVFLHRFVPRDQRVIDHVVGLLTT